MIASIKRRPHYRDEDLLISKQSGEFSYLPDEFTPHTITIEEGAELNSYFLKFDYPTTEVKDTKTSEREGVSFVFGKYSNKVIEIHIKAQSCQELISGFRRAQKQLGSLGAAMSQPSFRKNYELVTEFLSELVSDLEKNPEIANM